MTEKISQKTEGPPVAEIVFAKKTGVAADVIVDTRNITLTATEDWYERGARIYYTPSGVAKMLAALGAPADTLGASEPPPAAATSPAPPPAPEARLWYVVRRVKVNPRLLIASAEADGTGEIVRIRVRNNTTWRSRQEIHAIPPSSGSSHWSVARAKKHRRHSQ